MTQTLIQVENLTAGYGDNTILENVSFSVRQGEIVIILGGSGCGKSTLMNQMIGLQVPKKGKILYKGSDIVTATGNDRETILSSFGVAFQSGALIGSMSLMDNVMLPLQEHTKLSQEAVDWIARQKLRLVGLEGYEHHKPSELSGGMQKRAAMARAMSLDPDIMFLDEPSAGLDPITAARLDNLILQFSQTRGMTFVIVTHELHSILSLGGRVIMLDKSTRGIVAQGKAEDLKNDRSNPIAWSFFNRATEIPNEKNTCESSAIDKK
ncbi:MAG: ABC transporter ATP-binding protein [Planctomycetota bacterium]|jgi:phospholipid/cholesterol/gamma-HCH transport system ATP-binding protein